MGTTAKGGDASDLEPSRILTTTGDMNPTDGLIAEVEAYLSSNVYGPETLPILRRLLARVRELEAERDDANDIPEPPDAAERDAEMDATMFAGGHDYR